MVLLPISMALWVIGLATTDTSALGPYGLVTALSPAFFLGLVILVVSAGIEFSQSPLNEMRLGLHAAALVVMLYGTGAVVYPEGRYAWLYKTIGVVQYVDGHGSLDRSIDIYQNWPGFFALAGWFDRVAGVSSPLAYAKWTQVVFELAAIPLLYTIYSALALRPWHRWMAIMLYGAANWIGQDYFSPQGLSTLLSMGVMALIARWMFVVLPEKKRSAKWDAMRARRAVPFALAVLVLFFALTASHELTPYILTIQITALVICGLARPRWVAFGVAAVTVAYLVPNFTYVNNHFGVIASIGNFFSNIHPPSTATYPAALPVPKATRILNYCADLLCAGMWMLALVGAWLRRKARRIVFALLLLTFSPVLVLAGGAYGNEGVLRVYLFSLPWAAALAACALAPVRPRDGSGRLSPFRVIIPLSLAISLFFPAFYGYDEANTMSSSEVDVLLSFQETAQPGVILTSFENLPFSYTARYNQFPVGEIFGSYGVISSSPGPVGDMATYLARSVRANLPNQAAYVVMTPSMTAYNQVYNLTTPANLTALASSMAKSPYWHLVVSKNGTIVYGLATTQKVPSGPHSTAVVVAVP